MAPPVLLVVGPPASGKTSLLQRFLHDSCEDDPKPSIGMQTGMFFHLDPEDAIFAELRELLPSHGVTFELMEIGGREPVHREMPRGRYVCGLMLCYDCRDRTSFLRLKHVLCRHRMDRHMEISCSSVSAVGELAAVLCATKTDLGASAVTQAPAYLTPHEGLGREIRLSILGPVGTPRALLKERLAKLQPLPLRLGTGSLERIGLRVSQFTGWTAASGFLVEGLQFVQWLQAEFGLNRNHRIYALVPPKRFGHFLHELEEPDADNHDLIAARKPLSHGRSWLAVGFLAALAAVLGCREAQGFALVGGLERSSVPLIFGGLAKFGALTGRPAGDPIDVKASVQHWEEIPGIDEVIEHAKTLELKQPLRHLDDLFYESQPTELPWIRTECVIDVVQAAAYLGQAVVFLYKAIDYPGLKCPNNSPVGCAASVAGFITSITWIASYLSFAASACGNAVKPDALCAGDWTALMANFGEMATVGAAVKEDCDFGKDWVALLADEKDVDIPPHEYWLNFVPKLQAENAETLIKWDHFNSVQRNRNFDLTQCVMDVTNSASYIVRAILQIRSAALSCPQPRACAINIMNIISSFAWISQFTALAVSDCAKLGNQKALCAADISDMVAAVTNGPAAGVATTSDCADIPVPEEEKLRFIICRWIETGHVGRFISPSLESKGGVDVGLGPKPGRPFEIRQEPMGNPAARAVPDEVPTTAERARLKTVPRDLPPPSAVVGPPGVRWAFQTLVLLALRAELVPRGARRSHDDAGLLSGREAERAFALPCGLDVCTTLSGLTSPPQLAPLRAAAWSPRYGALRGGPRRGWPGPV
ncbi:unnamed protein product [Durusdinium trenchii]|uniref:Uncharacterized protein n=1 Tax=Durusdinium trenchii TaxID=1381693 RepID=A0ABP0S251_9DINO